MGRDTNEFELAVFSVLWSEHCGYKHSARLPTSTSAAGAITATARPSRSHTSADGSKLRSATLMNMNDAPQIRESVTISAMSRRLIVPATCHMGVV